MGIFSKIKSSVTGIFTKKADTTKSLGAPVVKQSEVSSGAAPSTATPTTSTGVSRGSLTTIVSSGGGGSGGGRLTTTQTQQATISQQQEQAKQAEFKLQAKQVATQQAAISQQERGVIFLKAKEAQERGLSTQTVTVPAGTRVSDEQRAIEFAEKATGIKKGSSGIVAVTPQKLQATVTPQTGNFFERNIIARTSTGDFSLTGSIAKSLLSAGKALTPESLKTGIEVSEAKAIQFGSELLTFSIFAPTTITSGQIASKFAPSNVLFTATSQQTARSGIYQAVKTDVKFLFRQGTGDIQKGVAQGTRITAIGEEGSVSAGASFINTFRGGLTFNRRGTVNIKNILGEEGSLKGVTEVVDVQRSFLGAEFSFGKTTGKEALELSRGIIKEVGKGKPTDVISIARSVIGKDVDIVRGASISTKSGSKFGGLIEKLQPIISKGDVGSISSSGSGKVITSTKPDKLAVAALEKNIKQALTTDIKSTGGVVTKGSELIFKGASTAITKTVSTKITGVVKPTQIVVSQPKLDTSTISVVIPKTDTALVGRSRSSLKSSTISQIKTDTLQFPVSKTKTAQVSRRAQLTVPESVLTTKQRSSQVNFFSSIGRPPRFAFNIPKATKEKPRSVGGFQVSVRRGGVFKPIATGVSLGRAFDIGQRRVGGTLAATFKVTPVGGGALPRVKTPKGFRRKKGLFIEEKEFRLSTTPEVKEIQTARLFS